MTAFSKHTLVGTCSCSNVGVWCLDIASLECLLRSWRGREAHHEQRFDDRFVERRRDEPKGRVKPWGPGLEDSRIRL
jgi:hypothetical protein